MLCCYACPLAADGDPDKLGLHRVKEVSQLGFDFGFWHSDPLQMLPIGRNYLLPIEVCIVAMLANKLRCGVPNFADPPFKGE